MTLGPFIRGKIRRVLHKTRTVPFIRACLIWDENSSYKWFASYFCSRLVFLWMLPVATAIKRGAPKIKACVLCVRALCKTRRSFIRSFSRLSYDASYLRAGVKGCSKIRRVLAKPRLILDEMSRLYGKFASYLRRVLCKRRLIFPRIYGPIVSH